MTKRQLILTGIVLLAYSAMFLIEGIGLLLLKHWAEWMTVITTAGLIPFEIYEMMHRPTRLKAAAMMINIVVAAYLAFRVRREAMEAKHSGNSAPLEHDGRLHIRMQALVNRAAHGGVLQPLPLLGIQLCRHVDRHRKPANAPQRRGHHFLDNHARDPDRSI